MDLKLGKMYLTTKNAIVDMRDKFMWAAFGSEAAYDRVSKKEIRADVSNYLKTNGVYISDNEDMDSIVNIINTWQKKLLRASSDDEISKLDEEAKQNVETAAKKIVTENKPRFLQ